MGGQKKAPFCPYVPNPDYSQTFLKRCFSIENRASSKYFGVYWNKQKVLPKKQWSAKILHNGKQHSIGCWEHEEDAARAVNFKCQEFNIPLKNPSVGIFNKETFEKLKLKVINFYS